MSYWDDMSKRYPRYNDAAMSKDVEHLLSRCEARGIGFEGGDVLDIGCGTGTVAIPLALRGAQVCALDICEGMLRTFEADLRVSGVGGSVRIHRSGWDGFVPERPYETTLASMTPAVSDATQIDKMLQFTTKNAIYVGWGQHRVNETVRALFEAHGCDYPMQTGSALRYYDHLRERGYRPEIEYFETSWTEYMQPDNAAAYAAAQLGNFGVTPNDRVVEEVLEARSGSLGVRFDTVAQKGIVLCSVK